LRYVSTRGEAPVTGFDGVLLAGLARDGGLYVPEAWPTLTAPLGDIARMSYAEAARTVMTPFTGGEIPDADLRPLLAAAYGSFTHAAVAPLVQIGPDHWLMELFHGPTLAFKDIAMQVLGRAIDRSLAAKGERATIVGATSGDTGSAAIEAFRGRDAIDIYILHPKGRTSAIQRKQMTTATEQNVHNIAVEGSFDDCQAIVKTLFTDLPFRDRLKLAGVNSINWARILPQVVYYVTSAAALSGGSGRPLRFSVPTGNFGDIFAGFVAKSMGVPVEQLILATNENDILTRTWATGAYEPTGVVPTQSPSMDIQVSSNFERLLFELSGRDAGTVRGQMASLKQGGGFRLTPAQAAGFRQDFVGERVDEATTTATMQRVHAETGMVVDPHTAVGIAAAERQLSKGRGPMITLATAHPAKFPDAVARAIGRAPEMPERLARQLEAPERMTVLPNDAGTVAAYIDKTARLGTG
jgi:threonine synthase